MSTQFDDFNAAASMSSYNANLLLEEFHIHDLQSIEAISIRHVFNEMLLEAPDDLPRLELRNYAVGETLLRLHKRIPEAHKYLDFFFEPGTSFKKEALIAALICDNTIENAQLPEGDWEQGEDESLAYAKNGMSEETIMDATVIYEEACELQAVGGLADREYSREAYFLAHINAMDDIRSIMREYFSDTLEFDDDREALRHWLKYDLPPILEFADENTLLGRHLIEFAEDTRDNILAKRPHIMAEGKHAIALRISYPGYAY